MSLPSADSAVWPAVAALIVWRVTTFVAYENGPFDLGLWLRRGMVRLRLGRLVTCFDCAGLWIGLAVAAVLYGISWRSGALGIALAGAASLAEHAMGVRSEE